MNRIDLNKANQIEEEITEVEKLLNVLDKMGSKKGYPVIVTRNECKITLDDEDFEYLLTKLVSDAENKLAELKVDLEEL